MYDWFVRIKDNEFDKFILKDIVFNKADKKEVKEYLLEEYSEILTCIREKMTSKTPENEKRYTTFITKLNDHWKKFWLEEVECEFCGRTYKRIELNKYSNSSDNRYCSAECKNDYEKYKKENIDYHVSKYSDYDAYIYRINHKDTGLFYVGVTTQWLMSRWWQHIRADTSSKFHSFMREHDISEFTFEVLEVFNPRDNDPFLVESKWIHGLQAIEHGLNTANGKKMEVKACGDVKSAVEK